MEVSLHILITKMEKVERSIHVNRIENISYKIYCVLCDIQKLYWCVQFF